MNESQKIVFTIMMTVTKLCKIQSSAGIVLLIRICCTVTVESSAL